MSLVSSIHVNDYQRYLSDLSAEYVRASGSKYLFYLHDVELWCVVERVGDAVVFAYYESEGDCGC